MGYAGISQASIATSVLVDRALNGFLRGGLGSGSVRAEGSSEVDDVSSADVVDETVDVNRFEGSAGVGTTMSRRGGAVVSLFLSDVGSPVLSHHRTDDDIEHRVLDVLLDESPESRVVELGIINHGLVLVRFSVRNNLRAARVPISVANRVNPTLNRVLRGVIIRRIRSRQHGSFNTATSIVTHDEDMSDAQSLNSVRQDANRVVVGGLELVRYVPLCEERTRRRGKHCSL